MKSSGLTVLDPKNTAHYVKEMRDVLNSISSKITESEKEIYSSISKFGKSLDKVCEWTRLEDW